MDYFNNNKEKFASNGFRVPSYDRELLRHNTITAPKWIHFGSGNIFRIFIASIADDLIEKGLSDTGIIAAESYDYEIIDKIYQPFDNTVIAVTLNADSSTDYRTINSIAEACKTEIGSEDMQKLKKSFISDSLQMVSFTVTEKAYGVASLDKEIEGGLDKVYTLIPTLNSLLYERFMQSGRPLALVSMDNCSQNGQKLQNAVMYVADKWQKLGFVPEKFIKYLKNSVSFPWTMIDKITPRPADSVGEKLRNMGFSGMEPVITAKNTYIAPYVNAEKPQYLVIEDNFPNGRPQLEKAGVYMTDRTTVSKVETMKVTTCLNPLHTALAVFGCILGYKSIADAVADNDLHNLIMILGYKEGMPVVENPGILSPEAFIDEVINQRLPNPYIPDTPQRIATDTSKKMSVRYGETIKATVRKYGSAERLNAVPLIIAGWLRYLLAIDDNGEKFTLSSDPELERLSGLMSGIEFGKPESCADGKLDTILSDDGLFGCDLIKAGLSEKVYAYFRGMISGNAAVRKVLAEFERY